MEMVVVVMAGGKGERFWPKSRTTKPKQFLSLTQDGQTLLQKTITRVMPIVGYDNILVVTLEEYKPLVMQQVPGLRMENIIVEPSSRNTAPCIALALQEIIKRWEDPVMVVVPADHLIQDEEKFRDCIAKGAEFATIGDVLVTIGIVPTYPEVGYGYIHYDFKSPSDVKSFEEKPSLLCAKQFLLSGEYLWNSGMFIWRTSVIEKCFKRYLPDLYKVIESGQSYEQLQSISIDYGIMEYATDVKVIHGDFGWDDVGSWLALERIGEVNKEGNVISGDVVSVKSVGCIVESGKKMVTLLGVTDLVVVDTPDVLLVAHKEQVPYLKELIKVLSDQKEGEYL